MNTGFQNVCLTAIRDEVLPGTNFMEDVLRVYQFSSENNFFHLLEENRRNMWLKPYANEVKDFLRTNQLSPDLLDNIWLLRCRISFSLESAWWKERNRYGHESEQIKRINFLRNHVLPFIKAIQGEWQYSQSDDNVHSVTFKTNKPGVKALKLEGHLANNMYHALQKMASKFLESNENFKPDLQTKRLRAGVGETVKGAYNTLRQYGVFKPDKPSSKELVILEDLLDLGVGKEGFVASMNPNTPTTEFLRKFFK